MRRTARIRSLVSALVLTCLGLAAACSPKKMVGPNTAPQTTLFVQFDAGDGRPHDVNHVVHLYWFGSDIDGYVVSYKYRFLWPGLPDTLVPTTRTDMVFTLPAPTGTSSPTFEVLAIDDDGLADPSPAVQTLDLSNLPPTVTLLNPPASGDTTYAAVTLEWTAADPDGDASQMQFLVWIDGSDALAHVYQNRVASLGPSDFLQGGKLRAGPRSAYVQAIDDGGMMGPPDTTTWYVRAPVPDTTQRPRLLIVDDVSPTSPNVVQNRTYDTLFINTARRAGLPTGSFEVLRLEFTQPFRSPSDLGNTLGLYDAVVWYRGTQGGDSSPRGYVIHDYWAGIDDYLRTGGRMFLEGLDVVEGRQAPGLAPEEAVTGPFGMAGLFLRRDLIIVSDSTADWGVSTSYRDTIGGVPLLSPAIMRSTFFQDSMKVSLALSGGIRAFVPEDTTRVALWARSRNLSPRQSFDAAVAVVVPQPGGGRFVATSVPLFAANGYANWARFLAKIFQDLGISGP